MLMKKQIICPNCGGFNTTPASPKRMFRDYGMVAIFVGVVTLVFIIGIPIFIGGIIAVAISFFAKENGKM